MLKPLLIIVGPTAVGKTDLAIMIAKKIPVEIISGDSMQVYRHMNIGTAKATLEEQQGITHHMIDILEPNEEFSVALFQSKVEELIEDIVSRNKLPILVGGTGLYIRSIIDNYNFSEFAVDWELRNRLKEEAESRGSEYLHQQLSEVDPLAASKIHQNDLRRITRALEVYHHTGQPISNYQEINVNNTPKYDFLMYGLNMEREKLYDGINKRVDKMINEGLVKEVQNLLDSGYEPSLPSMQAIGYKEIIDFIEGKNSLDDALEILKRNTRRFAKRQLTWFRRDERIKWFTVVDKVSLKEIAQEITEETCRTIFKHVE